MIGGTRLAWNFETFVDYILSRINLPRFILIAAL